MTDLQRASWVERLKQGGGSRHTWTVAFDEIPPTELTRLLDTKRTSGFDQLFVNVITEPDIEGDLVVVNQMAENQSPVEGYSALIQDGGDFVYLERSYHQHRAESPDNVRCVSKNAGTFFPDKSGDDPEFQATVERFDSFLSLATRFGKQIESPSRRFT